VNTFANERDDATRRVLDAIERDADPADADLLLCDPLAMTLAQLRERRHNPLLAAEIDESLGGSSDDDARLEQAIRAKLGRGGAS
jgi:hypothetical protein